MNVLMYGFVRAYLHNALCMGSVSNIHQI
uniref:Uncharacterized protein n=1 Tax=Anguilla anguilla TaxID=7936 RepID=A0A0E9RAP7_ANGAN